jgi:hypothetical protein
MSPRTADLLWRVQPQVVRVGRLVRVVESEALRWSLDRAVWVDTQATYLDILALSGLTGRIICDVEARTLGRVGIRTEDGREDAIPLGALEAVGHEEEWEDLIPARQNGGRSREGKGPRSPCLVLGRGRGVWLTTVGWWWWLWGCADEEKRRRPRRRRTRRVSVAQPAPPSHRRSSTNDAPTGNATMTRCCIPKSFVHSQRRAETSSSSRPAAADLFLVALVQARGAPCHPPRGACGDTRSRCRRCPRPSRGRNRHRPPPPWKSRPPPHRRHHHYHRRSPGR